MNLFVSFVIPTLNEHGNIDRLIKKINNIMQLNKINYEIIIVDDNSKDGTIEDVKKIQKSQDNLKLIVRRKERGIGTALIKGYNSAKGDLLLSIDADLSHPPEKIPEFIRKINNGFDMVMSSRYIPGGSVDKNIKNYLISKIGAYYLSLMFRIKIKDFTTAYRAIRRDLWEKIKNYKYSKRNIFLIESIFYAHRLGAKLSEVPIFFRNREVGESKTPLFKIAINSLIIPFKMRVALIINKIYRNLSYIKKLGSKTKS